MNEDRILYLALPFLVMLFVIGGFLLVWSLLGVFVWPGLFGGMFLFLPFVWVWRPRRPPPVDPRTNGHARSDR